MKELSLGMGLRSGAALTDRERKELEAIQDLEEEEEAEQGKIQGKEIGVFRLFLQ